MLFNLAYKSLLDRKASVLLTLISIVISVSLLFSVEHIRQQAKASFKRTVSGVDLIVGTADGDINLLLGSVFRIGSMRGSVSWSAYEQFSQRPQVAWTAPFSLGDSHKGFAVMGTTAEYFEHYQYGERQPLTFAQGQAFEDASGAVLGADVAASLNYQLGQSIVLSHGTGHVSFTHHEAHPFTITGILAPTGTPLDRTVHVDLQGISKIHETPSSTAITGAPLSRPLSRPKPASVDDEKTDHEAHEHEAEYEDEHEHEQGHEHNAEHSHDAEHHIDSISGFFMGLKTPVAALQLQHQINQYKQEPLQAILPGVALNQLWQTLGVMENILMIISVLILVSALFGLTTMQLASMRERNRELAVLRALGASPVKLFALMQLEALLIALAGIVLAFAITSIALLMLQPWLSETYGVFMSATLDGDTVLSMSLIVLSATALIAIFPSFSAYRQALHSHLSSR